MYPLIACKDIGNVLCTCCGLHIFLHVRTRASLHSRHFAYPSGHIQQDVARMDRERMSVATLG